MTKAVAFWLIYVVFFILALWFSWPPNWGLAGTLVIFALIGLVGWAVFGAMIKG